MITRDHIFTTNEVIHRNNVRSVYQSAEGKEELIRLLADCGVFREITPEEVPVRNLGIRKMEELGILDIELIRGFMDWFMTTPLIYRPTAEESGIDINSNDPI